MISTFKISLIGHTGAGKTSFVSSLQGEIFSKRFIKTLGVDVEPIVIPEANACFNIWDCAGDPRFGGLGDGYYVNSDACIVMFDVSSPEGMMESVRMIQGFRNVCPEVPMIIVGNKHDLGAFPNLENLRTCSSKNGEGCKDVLIDLLAQITNPIPIQSNL